MIKMDYVVLTRDPAKDASLIRALNERGVPYKNVPLLEHTPGSDHYKLPQRLQERWDWVIITSPTAADFLVKAWYQAGRPRFRVAALGKSTARVLTAAGVEVAYISPNAYGEYLAEDLGGAGRVLWPTSTLASNHMASILTDRGFKIIRLNVYQTTPKELNKQEQKILSYATLVALASPSAVRAWVQATSARPPVAAIGRVTAQAAANAGFGKVEFPENPGAESWANIIINLYKKIKGQHI